MPSMVQSGAWPNLGVIENRVQRLEQQLLLNGSVHSSRACDSVRSPRSTCPLSDCAAYEASPAVGLRSAQMGPRISRREGHFNDAFCCGGDRGAISREGSMELPQRLIHQTCVVDFGSQSSGPCSPRAGVGAECPQQGMVDAVVKAVEAHLDGLKRFIVSELQRSVSEMREKFKAASGDAVESLRDQMEDVRQQLMAEASANAAAFATVRIEIEKLRLQQQAKPALSPLPLPARFGSRGSRLSSPALLQHTPPSRSPGDDSLGYCATVHSIADDDSDEEAEDDARDNNVGGDAENQADGHDQARLPRLSLIRTISPREWYDTSQISPCAESGKCAVFENIHGDAL